MNYKTEALVLHTVRYGDTRLIIDMFAREQGRQSFIVSIGKGGRSGMRKQYFQPLTLLVIESDIRPLEQLQVCATLNCCARGSHYSPSLANWPSPFSLPSFSTTPFEGNKKTNVCSTMCAPAWSGSTAGQTATPTSTSCFSCACHASSDSFPTSTTTGNTSTSGPLPFAPLPHPTMTISCLRRLAAYDL